MTTYYLDIRNGDIAYTVDEKGRFIEGDYIKCGEWFTYKAEEVADFVELLKYYGFHDRAEQINKGGI